VNHSVGIAELRKVVVIRQNYPPAEGTPNDWKSRPSHSSRGKYLSPASNETPATSTVTVPTELLGSLHFSLILSYLRLSADASDFFFVLRSSQSLLFIECWGLSYAGIERPELEAERPVRRLRLSAAI